ncbi:histidine acid phosphatase-like protein [Delitschia confertaspora ATCC 74209]|uniref:Histidine acid phosphatase-like protein n=1 Tax=Delitschia confertaspora ATCC 74209 TaxID=1513339 RepID=A0A9P4JJ41_9PLEO|nr:histidine acid phosphatase-like protein [Delitschia confertaspora ATCC 74209]
MWFSTSYLLPALWIPEVLTSQTSKVDLNWYPPSQTWINSLSSILNGTGTHGFVFNSSQLPAGADYGTYNWCNMPHIRREEYPRVGKEYILQYVEVIHRHHKRTPYASNTFPKEQYSWSCSDNGLFYYGQSLAGDANKSASTYWSVFTSDSNPFAPSGFNGTCQFPQITKEGLDDSWQHGKDLYGVYHDLLNFLPKHLDLNKVEFRVTNNVITSQVSGMLISGMYSPSSNVPLNIQPPSIDSLESTYPCPPASKLYSSYGVGSAAANWTAHLRLASPLFSRLDAVSGIPINSIDWHKSLDHYFDNLSARQCHRKPLPCSPTNTSLCVSQVQANAVYRLGEYEYSFIYRDSPSSLQAAVGSFGVWVAELADHIRAVIEGRDEVVYRHNVAHDGSLARLLGMLQVEVMVWPGMGSEVVFEVYKQRGARMDLSRAGEEEEKESGKGWFIRVLWGGKVLRSSNPMLGVVDMVDLEVFLAYLEGLVGKRAGKVVDYCGGG